MHSFKKFFCVGDYDQSIYAFNEANINIISSFQKRHQAAKIFSFKRNYGSSALIFGVG